MQSFRFLHSFITINSIVMPTHRKSTGTTPFDSQTLGELYETYAPQLLRICLRYVKNQAEAEDVLHDAFVIIFTHIDHLRDETKLVHWMTVIVRNLALRQAKATEERRRLRETLTDETAALDNDEPAPEISTERLLEAIDALPRGYGEVFRLAVLDGLTHDEIGQLLGIAPHSSSSQLARAKRMLRKWLTDYRLLLILPVALGVWLYRLRNVHRPPAASMASLPVSPARKAPLRAAAASAAARKERGTGRRSKRADKATHGSYRRERTPGSLPPKLSVPSRFDALIAAERHDSALPFASLPALSRNSDSLTALHPLDREKVRPIASAVRDLAFAPRKSYPWTVNFGGGTGANASNSPVRFDYLSLTDHANGGVRRKIHSLQELSDYLVSNRSLLDSLEQAQLNRFLLNNVHSSEDLQNLNETERHQRPVTMSLSVGKQLSERWFFGTGVSYTRLDSEFESALHKGRIQKQQRIDYLGVPLRFTYRVWGKGRFDVYATGGATFEWPVRTSLKKAYVEATDSVTPLRTHFSAPCQWSVQLGAGVEYRIVRPFTLFVEPGVTHYFGTGTSVRTYRSEHPWCVTVPFGIRLTW